MSLIILIVLIIGLILLFLTMKDFIAAVITIATIVLIICFGIQVFTTEDLTIKDVPIIIKNEAEDFLHKLN